MNQTLKLRFRLPSGQPVIENWKTMEALLDRVEALFNRNGPFPFSVTIITEESI